MLVDKQSELMSDLLFTVHQHGGDDVTWKPPIVREWNVHLEICSRPQVIENSRQCLLLRTDILQKRVAGCPCCFYLGYVHTISNSFSCRHEKLSSTVSDVTLHSRQLRSVTQKSRRKHRSYVWTEALSRCVFRVSAKAIRYTENYALIRPQYATPFKSCAGVFFGRANVFARKSAMLKL